MDVVGFDLDGVIVDTKKANIEAYKHIGVTMPVKAYGQAASEWGVTREQSDRKAACYGHFLNLYAKKLSGFDALKYFYGSSEHAPIILTKASAKNAQQVLTLIGCQDVPFFHCSSAIEKADHLRSRRAIVYIDDFKFGSVVSDLAACEFIHYRPGMQADKLIDKILRL